MEFYRKEVQIIKKLILTKREDELMNFLWDEGRPLIVEEMLDVGGEHEWGENYLRIMLRSLEKKGAVEACGMVLRGKQYARQFRPAISKEEFYLRLAMNRGASAGALLQVAAAAVMKGKKEDTDEVVRQLEEMLEEYKARTDDEE